MIRMVINNSNSNNCPTRLNVLRPYSPSRVCFWPPCIRYLPFYYSYTLVVRNIWSMIRMRLILSVCNRRGEDIIYIMSCIIHIIIIIMAHCRGLPWSIHEERNSLPWMIRMIWDNLKCRNKTTTHRWWCTTVVWSCMEDIHCAIVVNIITAGTFSS